MTNEDKKMIMELIDTIQSAMSTLRTVIEKDEESSVPAADVTVTASKTESDSTPREIDERMVKKLLKEMGVPLNIKGYRYLSSAIVTLSKEKGMKISLGLYPKVAREFATTSSRVERAIRHAVERTFERGNYDVINEVFGTKVSATKGKLTNSEFMYACIEYLEDLLAR